MSGNLPSVVLSLGVHFHNASLLDHLRSPSNALGEFARARLILYSSTMFVYKTGFCIAQRGFSGQRALITAGHCARTFPSPRRNCPDKIRAISFMSNTKRALVPIADGSEEMEAVVIIDVLRRAGVEVTVASVSELNVRCSREVRIVADVLIEDALKTEYDVIALPVRLG